MAPAAEPVGQFTSAQVAAAYQTTRKFAPGNTELIGSVIKVQAAMSAESVSDSGRIVLAISVNYIFAYAVETPANPADWMRVVTHLSATFDFAQWDDPGGPLEPWDTRTSRGQAGVLSDNTDGYLHPNYPSERGPGAHPSPSGPALNPCSLGTNVPAGCTRTTNT